MTEASEARSVGKEAATAPAGGNAAAARIQCLQVWGGSGVADTSVSTTGLTVWLYSRPYGNHDQGGDVYYLSSCSSGRITRVVLADVRGHGHSVADLAVRLRRLMSRHIDHVNQRTLVQSINSAFVSVGDASTFATGLVATFFLPTETLALTNAGHPAPLLLGTHDEAWRPLERPVSSSGSPTNVPLGMFDNADYPQVAVSLLPGDLLLCYTDGLEECLDARGEMVGQAGVMRLLEGLPRAEPDRIIPGLLGAVESMSAGNLAGDDVTIMLIQANGSGVPLRDSFLAPFRYVSRLIRSQE